MGNSTGNPDKKNTKTSQNDEKMRGVEISGGKGTGNTGKITVQIEEINQKVLAKERRLKRYRQSGKQYWHNRTFQNNQRKFYQHDAKETERFWTKIWQPKKHNENAEWINTITRELVRLEKGPKTEIHIDWKAPGHDEIHGFRFKKFSSFHGWLALEMNRCLQGPQVPEWMTKGTTTSIQNHPSKELLQTITDR